MPPPYVQNNKEVKLMEKKFLGLFLSLILVIGIILYGNMGIMREAFELTTDEYNISVR